MFLRLADLVIKWKILRAFDRVESLQFRPKQFMHSVQTGITWFYAHGHSGIESSQVSGGGS